MIYGNPMNIMLECKKVTNKESFGKQQLIIIPTNNSQNKKSLDFLHKREMLLASEMFNTKNLSDSLVSCHGENTPIKIQKFITENNELFAVTESGNQQYLHNDFSVIKFKHSIDINDKCCINKKTNDALSISDICNISTTETIKLNIIISTYAFLNAQKTVYISGKIKKIIVMSSDITTLMVKNNDVSQKNKSKYNHLSESKQIVEPKQSSYISMYPSKKNTILNNIMNIINTRN